MSFWTVLNILGVVVLWNWAIKDFENGNLVLGWLNLFFSAWNGAALASQIF